MKKWLKVYKEANLIDYLDVTDLTPHELSMRYDVEGYLGHLCALTTIPPPDGYPVDPVFFDVLQDEDDYDGSHFFGDLLWVFAITIVVVLAIWGITKL